MFKKSFQYAELLKRPLTARYLEGVNPSIPDELMKYLYFVTAGKQKVGSKHQGGSIDTINWTGPLPCCHKWPLEKSQNTYFCV